MATSTDSLDHELVWRLLAHPTREALLRYLAAVDRTTVSSAATWLADSSAGPDPGLRSVEYRTITVALVHNHLPRLDDYAVVDYDHIANVIERGPNFATLESELSAPDPSVEPS